MATRAACQSMMTWGLVCIQAKAAWTGRFAARLVTRENALLREKSAIADGFKVSREARSRIRVATGYSTE